jgi:hypothetical protein
VLQPLFSSWVGHKLLDEAGFRVIEVVDRIQCEVGGGADERDALARGAMELQAAVLVLAVAKRAGEWVVVNKSLGEGGRDDVEGVGSSGRGGIDISPEVAEGDMEVAVGVEVGERERVVVEEGRVRREDDNTLCVFYHFHGYGYGYGYGYVYFLSLVPLPREMNELVRQMNYL